MSECECALATGRMKRKNYPHRTDRVDNNAAARAGNSSGPSTEMTENEADEPERKKNRKIDENCAASLRGGVILCACVSGLAAVAGALSLSRRHAAELFCVDPKNAAAAVTRFLSALPRI